ncbi:hypothetical protein GGR95_000819 [Sulfitobacter undariae]|uniref:Uncharacterized protein n=1 Tax=Sulfitobacter undariae TaxID=1563671 RepID=A0A7W6E4C7_9RHOB|nr:hypothetical protein [Sulfitobacter undariae]MBB3993191.1 hypothetical protein [Sulfitobacter undariae]
MTVIDIPQSEHGVIRVFAISRPMADMARTLKQQPKSAVAAQLLNHSVSEGEFELFALSDLTGVGLMQYLSDGYDVDKAALRRDQTRLQALDGYVLLLFSKVSDAGGITFTPDSALTLIGTYAEPQALHGAAPIASDAAKLYSGVGGKPTTAGRMRMGSGITAVAMVLILLLIWWILK